MKKYAPPKIEAKWQKRWAKDGNISKADDSSKKRKFYCLSMFPYPSGDGLHVGHVESYTATDIYSRYKRMQGFNVLYPIGWDAFGLPAENYAIKTGVHPAKTTARSIAVFKQQIKSLGLSYDWSREIDSSSPEYYKWTQWFFLLLYKKGLAYKAKAKVNWCPQCQTTLANEQVVNGRCERCESQVSQKNLEQWFFRITEYAERMLDKLGSIDWPHSIKEMQKNWIGKSEGAEIFFELKRVSKGWDKQLNNSSLNNIEIAAELKKYPTVARVKIFTTRPDTIFGATFLVMAPDGKAIKETEKFIKNKTKLKAYQLSAIKKNELERTELNKEKTGINLEELVAVNPANNHPMPVWVADYVMGDYGSGAVMAVPAHDERDFEFAFRHGLRMERTNYQEEKYLAFLELSFVKEPDRVLAQIRENFRVDFLSLSHKGFTVSSNLPKKPYGVFINFSKEKSIRKLAKIIQPQLKNSFWFEIVGGKFLTFIFADSLIKDDSDENREKIRVALKKAMASLNKRRKFNPRIDFLKKVLASQIFVPDFIPWTIPASNYRELVCYSNKRGHIYNSAFLDGMSIERGFEKILEWLEEKNIGRRAINYRIRDWLVSRQRYWGAPIPIVYCKKCGIVPVPEKELPVKLPKNVDFTPTGESPLKKLSSFYKTKCPKCGETAKREVDTMDTFVCSSWYHYRFCDPQNDKEFASQEKIRKFMPVDLYIGGAEHAVLHLLYSRFFTKVLQDAGYIDFSEPFLKLRNQGIILGPDHNKMSKSKGNVINPNEIVAETGADSLRVHEMFMGPLEDMKPWDSKGILGARRFLEKVWNLQKKVHGPQLAVLSCEENVRENIKELENNNVPGLKLKKLLHRTIKKVSGDIELLSFNTAISQMMILVNEFKKADKISKEEYFLFLKILAPFAPHIVEEIWENLGNSKSIFYEQWPISNPEFLKTDEVVIAIQINGKRRDLISLETSVTEEEARRRVLSLPRLQKYLKGKIIRKWVYVPRKIVNIVVD